MSMQIEHLYHTYAPGMPDEHTALSDVSFSLEDGEITGIIGHTGSGKSTLLQHLNGLLQPSSGVIRMDGVALTDPQVSMQALRRQVGLVFQYPEYQLFEETVAQDVAFGPRNLGLTDAEVRDRVEEALTLVGLDPEIIGERSPFELSGGQKRRVAIAGVLAMRPRVLILDEPTAGLDPGAHRDMLRLIREVHRQQHNTTVFVSHNMADVAALSDRILVMNDGRLVMQGAPQEIFARREELVALGLGVPPVTELMHQLREAGLPVAETMLTLDEAEEEIARVLQQRGRVDQDGENQ